MTILREEVSHPGVSLVDLELVPLDVGAGWKGLLKQESCKVRLFLVRLGGVSF